MQWIVSVRPLKIKLIVITSVRNHLVKTVSHPQDCNRSVGDSHLAGLQWGIPRFMPARLLTHSFRGASVRPSRQIEFAAG